jgi:3-hydroxyisobutyrate dehydrogenase-like beta-hydroxyacid dehydrogenase
MMEIVAEAHVLAEKSGLGSKNLEALIEQQYGPLALSMSQRLTTGAYMPARGDRPWSDLNLALKDVGHGITCAEQAGTRLEVAEVAIKHLKEASQFSEAEGRPLDSSSMYGILRKEAGLSFETDLVKERDEKKEKESEDN